VKLVSIAVQFGAGNIGRGFMGQLFSEAGYRTVFVERNHELVRLINERRCYTLRLLDAYSGVETDLTIGNVKALASTEVGQVAARIAEAEVAGTAVGVENLPSIAPLIAQGVRVRRAAGRPALDVYLCENSYAAATTLKRQVLALLDPAEREWAEQSIGFVGTSVARMVPTPQDLLKGMDPLFVAADSYHRLPFDATAARAPQPPIQGMKPARSFKAEVERKLFTHNLGHAVLGYVGYLRGHSYVHESCQDPYVSGIFSGALQETAHALLRRYPEELDPREHEEILADARVRLCNPMIMDTVHRVARDPLRKLGSEDRLIGSARLCLAQGVDPANIAFGCGAALCYDWPGDPAAARLQQLIAEQGVERTLRAVAGVDPQGELGRKIVKAYREILGLRQGGCGPLLPS
jgi:mannitol-1-phosphate 5-dehydrogenase